MAIKKKKTMKKKTTAKKAPAKKSARMKKKVAAPNKAARKTTQSLARVGETVPDLTLEGTNGSIQLSTLKGKKVVLWFYPKDATPGCTLEGHEFSKLLEEFSGANAEVFGVSRDTLASHEQFRSRENYTVHLLSDTGESACQKFDVIKMKNMYGKQVRGIERSTFVIDQDGKLIKEWRKVSVPGHASEVLQFIKTI